MKAPDKIYVQIDKLTGAMFVNYDRNDQDNIEYVRKDFLLEWVREKLQERHAPQFRDAIGQVIDKINSI